MKKIVLLVISFTFFSASAQVGVGTIVPNAQLDVVATNRGILMPRVDLTSLLIAAPVTNPQGGTLTTSTMIYHNGTNGITAGYYYWDGARWQGIGKSSEDKGLQYYVFSATSGSTPNTEKSNINAILSYSGVVTGALNNTTMNTLRGVYNDNFMILFTGTLVVATAGLFQFQSVTDDGSRVVIDGIPVLNRWSDQGVIAVESTAITLARGRHKIEFWYYENAGGEDMTFNWVQNTLGATGTINGNSFSIE